MPELPEVEVLVRHLRPLLIGKSVRRVHVCREKVIRPSSMGELEKVLKNATFKDVERRGKYLLFHLDQKAKKEEASLLVLGHLGMTGRMYLRPAEARWPKHAAVVLELGSQVFIFEDTRYFGRFTHDLSCIQILGPEPLSEDFTAKGLKQSLSRSGQPIKTKLLDQQVVAGIGNIYASEALFRARLSPKRQAKSLTQTEVLRLWQAIREVLSRAIEGGSTVPLDFSGESGTDKLFYYGRSAETPDFYEEELRVYGQAGRPCPNCSFLVKRIVQAGRSTFYCPKCQRR